MYDYPIVHFVRWRDVYEVVKAHRLFSDSEPEAEKPAIRRLALDGSDGNAALPFPTVV